MSEFRTRYRGVGSVRTARHAVVEFVRAAGFCSHAVNDIALAAGEALANAAEHGGGWFTLHCTLEPSGALSVEIKDGGSGFDPGHRAPRVNDPSTETRARGYGIFLMRELMDRIEFSENGSKVLLVKQSGICNVCPRASEEFETN
jgi:anti-sigma regulatory factor (Ser/Thr protein kinase)